MENVQAMPSLRPHMPESEDRPENKQCSFLPGATDGALKRTRLEVLHTYLEPIRYYVYRLAANVRQHVSLDNHFSLLYYGDTQLQICIRKVTKRAELRIGDAGTELPGFMFHIGLLWRPINHRPHSASRCLTIRPDLQLTPCTVQAGCFQTDMMFQPAVPTKIISPDSKQLLYHDECVVGSVYPKDNLF